MGACTACHLVLRWWSGCRDLNPGPLRPERSALPSCATARSELPRSRIILHGDPRPQQCSDDRRDLGCGRLVVLDDYFTDASFLDRLHAKRPVLVGIGRTRLGDLTGEVQDETGNGDVLAFGNRDAERLFDLIDVGLSVDEPPILADPHDGRFLVLVELVVQVTDQLLEDVADRYDAGHTAVFVQDK